jgi:hypothetical protein
MVLDSKISEAIEAAVQDEGQSPALARRLIAWMEAATSGNEDLSDPAATARHLEVLYEAATPSDPEEERS